MLLEWELLLYLKEILLAQEIKQQMARPEFGIPVEKPVEGIRATVIGASQYTVQVSGNTIFISKDGILPLRNLQVVAPYIQEGEITRDAGSGCAEGSVAVRFDKWYESMARPSVPARRNHDHTTRQLVSV